MCWPFWAKQFWIAEIAQPTSPGKRRPKLSAVDAGLSWRNSTGRIGVAAQTSAERKVMAPRERVVGDCLANILFRTKLLIGFARTRTQRKNLRDALQSSNSAQFVEFTRKVKLNHFVWKFFRCFTFSPKLQLFITFLHCLSKEHPLAALPLREKNRSTAALVESCWS